MLYGLIYLLKEDGLDILAIDADSNTNLASALGIPSEQSPELLYRITKQFDAKKCEFGDASIQLYVLPRIPLTLVIWGSCDEFDARASIFLTKRQQHICRWMR